MTIMLLEREEQFQLLEEGDLLLIKWQESSREFQTEGPLSYYSCDGLNRFGEAILQKNWNHYLMPKRYLAGKGAVRKAYLVRDLSLKLEVVSEEQVTMMKNALGMDKSFVPTKNKAYTEGKDANWEDLVEKRFAEKREGFYGGQICYCLVYEAAKLLYGEPLSSQTFERL